MARFIEDTREEPIGSGEIELGEWITCEDGAVGQVTDLLDFYPGWYQIVVDGIYRGVCEDEIVSVDPDQAVKEVSNG